MWVARNKDGRLFIFIDKPKRSKINNWWEVDTKNTLLRPDDCLEINGEFFPNLRWEDYPIEVVLKPNDEALNEKHWNEVRNNAAIAAMQAAITRYTSGRYNEWLSGMKFSEVANFAVKCADHLIKELKNK